MDIADRMKSYEFEYRYFLPKKSFYIARIDGRAFHSFTKHLDKPFDRNLISSFVKSMKDVSDQIQGFILAYHQSDEVSFLFTDTQFENSQIWFDGKINKINSITASLFTYYFNYYFFSEYNRPSMTPAIFDCRVFSIPREDLPNYFVWRQLDYHRNSVNMFASSIFSHKQLMGKSTEERLNMIKSVGDSWHSSLENREKYGTFLLKDKSEYSLFLDYYELDSIINNKEI